MTDWTWHFVGSTNNPKNDVIVLTDDYLTGRVKLEIRQADAQSLKQAQVEKLVEETILSLQEALKSPSRLRKRAPGSA